MVMKSKARTASAPREERHLLSLLVAAVVGLSLALFAPLAPGVVKSSSSSVLLGRLTVTPNGGGLEMFELNELGWQEQLHNTFRSAPGQELPQAND